jgi:PleD family two-component response regulator
MEIPLSAKDNQSADLSNVCREGPIVERQQQMPNVVVIDDRVTNRNILTRLAASVEEGIQVKAFASPQAALEWLAGAAPDLIITD